MSALLNLSPLVYQFSQSENQNNIWPLMSVLSFAFPIRSGLPFCYQIGDQNGGLDGVYGHLSTKPIKFPQPFQSLPRKLDLYWQQQLLELMPFGQKSPYHQM